jgi:hypothetical protein
MAVIPSPAPWQQGDFGSTVTAKKLSQTLAQHLDASHDEPLSEQFQEMAIDSLGKKGLRPRKRQAYSEDNTSPIGTIFGCPAPYQRVSGEEFLAHHPHLIARVPYPFAAPKVGVGIEVEVENVLKVDPNVNLFFWHMKPDGSLRNGGQEFITPGVISVSLVEVALRQLFEGLNSDVDFSSRTSIHVHMDVHQLNLDQLLGLLLTYTAVENLMFKFVGTNRRTNIFCVPITETGLFDFLAGGKPKAVLHAIDQYWSKYTALNLLPIVSQGSVEFRHMPGTNNIENILRWIDLITRLKLYVYKYDLKTIVNQIVELNSTSYYKQFVEGVFGNLMPYLDDKHLLTDMERPVYLVKNSALANHFNENVLRSVQYDSQLGTRLGLWTTTLSKAQMLALKQLAHNHGATDLEELWGNIVRGPEQYLKGWVSERALLEVILSPVQVEPKTPTTPGVYKMMADDDLQIAQYATLNKVNF